MDYICGKKKYTIRTGDRPRLFHWPLVYEQVPTSRNEIGHMIGMKYRDKYVCSNRFTDEVYHYDGHVWKKGQFYAFMDRALKSFRKFLVTLDRSVRNGNCDDAWKKIITDDINKAYTEINKGGLVQRDIIRCSFAHITDDGFTKRLDANPDLTAFKTQYVFDAAENRVRETKAEDYITHTLEYDYEVPSPERLARMKRFMQTIFTDPRDYEYVLNKFASVLRAGNEMRELWILVGPEGKNGKSTFAKVFKKILGRVYLCRTNARLITGDRIAVGKPHPELLLWKDARLALIDELSSQDVIQPAIVKQLTGGTDEMWARDLYQKGEEASQFEPACIPVIVTNALPNITNCDSALNSRIKVIRFESQFLPFEQCADTFERQLAEKKFPSADADLDQLLEDVSPTLLYDLVRRFIAMTVEGTRFSVPDPPSVRLATDQYKRSVDHTNNFILERLVTNTGQIEDVIRTTELYTTYKSYMKDNILGPTNNNVKIVSRSELLRVIAPYCTSADVNRVTGIRFLED